MNSAVKINLTGEQIIARIKRRVLSENPKAYHIHVGDFTFYKKERYGYIINTYVKAEVEYTIDGKDFSETIEFGIL